MRIAVGANGRPWAVTSTNTFYQLAADLVSWTARPGRAIDVAVGPNNVVFVTGMNGDVFRWDSTRLTWTNVNYANMATARSIALDASGRAWVSTSSDLIYRWTANHTWTRSVGPKTKKNASMPSALKPGARASDVTQLVVRLSTLARLSSAAVLVWLIQLAGATLAHAQTFGSVEHGGVL
jgi:hypothetical protein